MATAFKHSRTPHHLSQHSSEHSGWMDGVVGLSEHNPATQLLAEKLEGTKLGSRTPQARYI